MYCTFRNWPANVSQLHWFVPCKSFGLITYTAPVYLVAGIRNFNLLNNVFICLQLLKRQFKKAIRIGSTLIWMEDSTSVSEQRNISCHRSKLIDQFLLVNQAISETLITKTLYNQVPRFSINLWYQRSWGGCTRRLWSLPYPCYSYKLLNGCACVIYCIPKHIASLGTFT